MKADSILVVRDTARVLRFAVLSLALGLTFSAQASAQVRTWTDSTGRHKMQAKFVEVADGKVKLEREDGSQFAIDLKKLSEADQKYVAEQASDAASPFQAVPPMGTKAKKSEDEEDEKPTAKKRTRQAEPEEEDTPRMKRKPRRSAEAEDEEAETEEDGPREVKPRWKQAAPIALTPSKDKWSLKISAPAESLAVRKNRAVVIPPKDDFFEGLRTVVVNPVIGWAALGYTWDKHGKGSRTRLAVCDLVKGKFLGAAWTGKAGLMIPLAMRDNGIELVMRSEEFGFGKHDRLELWKMTGQGISRQVQWKPYGHLEGGNRDVIWAAFLDTNRLATMNSGGRLAVWDMEKVQPVCYGDTNAHGCIPALSPDRKYIAFAADDKICLFDVEAQEVTGVLQAPAKLTFPICRFTPKGTRLICGAFNRIYVWDLATGGLFREIWTDKIHIDEQMFCPSEDHILVGNQTLVDIESQIRLWTYSGHERCAILGDTCLFAVNAHNQQGAVIPAVIPQSGVREALKKALANPEFFVLQPGTTVRLNLNALSDPGEREKASTALTQKLTANGFTVGPNGTIELAALTESTKQIEVAYHGFGMFGHRVYKMQEYVSRLRFVYQGKTAWEGQANNVPGSISLKEGETVEQVLRQNEKPNYRYFQTAELPRLLTNPSGSATLGTSKVTAMGLQ